MNDEINRMMKELAVCSVSSFEAWLLKQKLYRLIKIILKGRFEVSHQCSRNHVDKDRNRLVENLRKKQNYKQQTN